MSVLKYVWRPGLWFCGCGHMNRYVPEGLTKESYYYRCGRCGNEARL